MALLPKHPLVPEDLGASIDQGVLVTDKHNVKVDPASTAVAPTITAAGLKLDLPTGKAYAPVPTAADANKNLVANPTGTGFVYVAPTAAATETLAAGTAIAPNPAAIVAGQPMVAQSATTAASDPTKVLPPKGVAADAGKVSTYDATGNLVVGGVPLTAGTAIAPNAAPLVANQAVITDAAGKPVSLPSPTLVGFDKQPIMVYNSVIGKPEWKRRWQGKNGIPATVAMTLGTNTTFPTATATIDPATEKLAGSNGFTASETRWYEISYSSAALITQVLGANGLNALYRSEILVAGVSVPELLTQFGFDNLKSAAEDYSLTGVNATSQLIWLTAGQTVALKSSLLNFVPSRVALAVCSVLTAEFSWTAV
jgi:hypothetical protein